MSVYRHSYSNCTFLIFVSSVPKKMKQSEEDKMEENRAEDSKSHQSIIQCMHEHNAP